MLVVLPPAPGAGATGPYRFACTADGRSVEDEGSGSVDQLPEPADGQVLVVAPWRSLSWHQVQLPKGARGLGSAPLRKVLEGVLEERVLAPVSSLHFALEPEPSADGKCWVAVCSREWLEGVLSGLRGAGRSPSRIVPEFAPSPGDAAMLEMLAFTDSGGAFVAGGSALGVCVLPLQHGTVDLIASTLSAGKTPATRLSVEPDCAILASQGFAGELIQVEANDRLLRALRNGWELGQGEFNLALHRRWMARIQAGATDLIEGARCRWTRRALGLTLICNIFGLNLSAWRDQAELDGLQSAVRGVVQASFPEIRLVVEPQLQMDRALQALSRRVAVVGSDDFEPMLGALARTLPPDVGLRSVDYRDRRVTLTLADLKRDDMKALTHVLEGQGYIAQMDGETLLLTPRGRP